MMIAMYRMIQKVTAEARRRRRRKRRSLTSTRRAKRNLLKSRNIRKRKSPPQMSIR